MQLLHDLRFSLRQLRKAPVFTLVAVVTLALDIGANTAIFTLLDQALLRALPVSHPEQLVRLEFTGSTRGHFNSFGGDDHDYFSYPMYRDLRDQSGAFENLIASDLQNVSVQWNNKPDLVGCELASGNYFQALGLQPALGRLFLPADDVPNSSPVVVLSFNYWKRQFGSDPGVINQTLLINTHPFTIVGVAPPGFHSIVAGATEEVFVPLTTKNIITPRWQDLDDFNSHWMMVVGRLKPGISRGQAEASLQPLWHALRAAELAKIPNASEHLRRTYLDESHILVLDSGRGFSPLRDQIGTQVMIVMGMVVLLLLMACVNVSSLLLVRAAGRVREMSVRYAMGAGCWQIVRQLLAEGLLLGLLGGALGLLLAPAVSAPLIHRIAGDTATDLPFSSTLDMRILLFTFALALVVSLLFSLAPALRFLHPDLANSLKQQSTTSGGGQLRFRRALVAVQIGLSLLLLVGAGLFVRTLHNLRTLDVGFATDHLVSFGIDPRLAGYQTGQVFPLYRRVLQTLSALPGARAVGGHSVNGCGLSRAQVLPWFQRQPSQAFAGSSEDGIRYCWSHPDDRRFTCACRGQVFAVNQHHIDLRHVFEPRHAIFGEMRIQDASGGETHFLEKRPANAHHDRTLDLVAQSVGIDHCAALQGLHDASNAHRLGGADVDLGDRRDMAALLESAGHPEAALGGGFLLAPRGFLRNCFEHGAPPVVGCILQPELQGIHTNRVR